MTRLPGHAFLSFPPEMDPWVEELAGGLVAIHATDVSGPGAAHLPRFTGERTARQLEPGPDTDRRIAALPRGEAILAALRERWPPPAPAAPVLAHGDFFSGNTVWYRGRLSGIVDWGDAVIGPREVDVCEARLDLALLAGPEWAGRILRRYEALSGYRPQCLVVWDLMLAWAGSLLVDLWCQALQDVGTPIGRETLVSRLHAFALGALSRAA